VKLPKKTILPGPPPPGRPTIRERLDRKVPLTDDQKAQLDQMTPETKEPQWVPPFPPIGPEPD
jgi:hypothetical protein